MNGVTNILTLLLSLGILSCRVSGQKSSPIANWHMSDPHYTRDQYAKILGEAGVGQDPDEKDPKGLGPMQIQYVDYQPNCQPGGIPVCATNGTENFYFENSCFLEAANIKLLFQYGTELEPTEMERCLPTCQTMKCTKVERPVCALAEIGGALPQTFINECEMRRRECHTKQVLRILHAGPCETPTKAPRKKKLRRNKHKRPSTKTTIHKFAEHPKKVYIMLATPAPWSTSTTPRTTSTTTRITTTARSRPTKLTSTSPSPMQFQQIINLANPMVSVSRAVDAYNVYNIPDVGQDYAEITDSSLSMFLPEVGRVTEPYSMTSSTTTTTTTTTPKPTLFSTTTKAFRTTNLQGNTTIRAYTTQLVPSTTEIGKETTAESTTENFEPMTYPSSTTSTTEKTTEHPKPKTH
ncbi:integumentary mucin C.1 [Drosophila ficusphila]|uniref:integumentary mucin C.1 n=1 Tax=Drosophila ficusphila TaxID=30025 RepID=UPI0007E6C43A|nr:integumentary mucin C.1 [Drosophila ficusphila]